MLSDKDFANNKLLSSCGHAENKQKWQDLAKTLNAMGGTRKDTQQWENFWIDQKSNAKKSFITTI